MLIKNVWYVAAHSDEVEAGGILGRTIAGERIVFCRRDDGTVFALEDQCAHRRAPLSMGELTEGANLRCSYHGITFDGIGKCVSVPGQASFPADWQIRTYPVIEKFRYLWVWTGDPAKCSDQSSIRDFMTLGEPPYESRNGLLPVAGDYRLLVDNLLDATHAEFVHRSSFGSSDWQVARKTDDVPQKQSGQFDVDFREDGIDFVFRLNDVTGGPCFGKAYAMSLGKQSQDTGLDIRMDVSWQPPGLFLYGVTVSEAGADASDGLQLVNLHLLTPETEYTTHYLYRCSVLNTNGNPDIMEFWRDVDVRAFNEDKRIIEAQQTVTGERDLFDDPLWSIQGDQMSVRGRRLLKDLVAGETEADLRSAV